MKLNHIGIQLESKILNIKGNVGDDFAQYAKECVMHLVGNAGENFSHGSEDCTINVVGDVKQNIGYKTIRGHITINGEHYGLSKEIGERTEIYHIDENNDLKRIH